MLHITAIYAGLIGLFYTYVSLHVSLARGASKISMGDGGQTDLNLRIRAHANFNEYAPITLILLALAENLGAPALVLHGAGLTLLATRGANFYGLTSANGYKVRYWGALATYVLLLILSLAVLGHAVM